MNALVREWRQKAEGDYATALRECRARKDPNYDAAGFHAQQCVEKYLKAVLQKHKKPFSRIHDLLMLLEQCSAHIPELELHKQELAFHNRFPLRSDIPGSLLIANWPAGLSRR